MATNNLGCHHVFSLSWDLNIILLQIHTIIWGIIRHWIFILCLSFCLKKGRRNVIFWELIFFYVQRFKSHLMSVSFVMWENACFQLVKWNPFILPECQSPNIFCYKCILHFHPLSSCYLMHVLCTKKWCLTWCPAYHISIIHICVTNDNKNLDFWQLYAISGKWGMRSESLGHRVFKKCSIVIWNCEKLNSESECSFSIQCRWKGMCLQLGLCKSSRILCQQWWLWL